jgi:hypothetical protein
VHNAIPAQNAIFTGNRGEISAISATLALENGVALAASRLEECEKIAVLSYFEDMNNEILSNSNLIYALLLVLEKGEDFSLEFSSNLNGDDSNLNSDFAFLRAMLEGKNKWQTRDSNLIWTWRRETAN